VLRADIKHQRMQWLDTYAISPPASRAPTADAVQLWLWSGSHANPALAAAQARVRMQRTLAAQLGVDESALRFVRGAHGKPALAQTGMPHFNLSHSGAVTALALAQAVDVGVDVEQPRRARDVLALAQRYFAPAETATLARLSAPQREAAFYALWTCKEAVLKALGRGIAFGLDRLEFELEASNGLPRALAGIAVEGGAAAEWQVYRFEPAPGGFGALAWRGPALRVIGFRAAD
jgi:4'-phosphopantetheinyl transferase